MSTVSAARRRASSSDRPTPDRPALSHVELVGGTAEDWLHFGAERWRWRISTFAKAVGGLSVSWLTLRPVAGDVGEAGHERLVEDLLAASGGALDATGAVVATLPGGVTVAVDPDAHGRRRFARTLDRLVAAGQRPDDLDETTLAAAVLAPAGVEPDLVVVLGPPTRLPPSLVWELAYAELVFLDLPWADLGATHLQLAVDDYRRRDRRFGGIDA
jgi:undecaprenyl diphosphate synthase